jgi:hypothetical protein
MMSSGLKTILVLFLFPAVMVGIGVVALRSNLPLAQPPTLPSVAIERHTPIRVDLASGSRERLYSFTALPDRETRVQFRSDLPGFDFSAELRDAGGQPVALLDSAHLQTVEFIIEPGAAQYHLALAADEQAGSVSFIVDEPPLPTPEPEPLDTFCGMVSAHMPGVRVYRNPRADADDETVGALRVGEMVEARGRLRGGWYLTELDGQPGWLPQDAITLYGACDRLPIVLDPAIPLAPRDVEPYIVSLDRDGDSRLRETVAYPRDDTRDFIWINVMNLHNQSPANYREIGFTLLCDGIGAESLRWGAPEDPSYRCGDLLLLPFTYDYNLQPLVVMFPDGVEQSYVEYELVAASMNGLRQ